MRQKNKWGIIIPLALTCSFLFMNSSLAITDKTDNDEQNETKVELNNEAENKNNEVVLEAVAEYTNDVHSVFTLEDCVNIAIKKNPAIMSAMMNEDVYKSKIGQAWSQYFPKLGASVAYTRSQNNYRNVDYTVADEGGNNFTYLPRVSADMMIFDFGKTNALAGSAKKTYESKQYTTKESINSIIYEIKSTYYNVLFARAQVKVYEDTVKDYELQLKQAESFYTIGKKAKIDVITAQYNLGKAQLNLVKAKNVYEVALVQLAKIMGIPHYTNFEISGHLMAKKYNVEEDTALQTAFDVRPELIAASKNVEAAKLNLKASKRAYAPDFHIFASYENDLASNYDLSSTQFGGNLKYTDVNFMKLKKLVDEANASYKKSMADYEEVKHSVHLKVKKNYLELQTAQEAIIISKLALDEAKEQYRQVTGRYKAGVGDAIELKDGETTYLNARLDFYNSLLNYNTTAASLEKEIGVPIEVSNEDVLKLDL